MLKIENFVTPSPDQWMFVIDGMRNPKNSWDRMDSYTTHIGDNETLETAEYAFFLGEKDEELAMSLAKGGPVHAKYRRQLPIHVKVTAPLYWWKEFDTYRVGVCPNPTDIEMNSCSTMHKIHSKEFTLDDFSCEHLIDGSDLIKDKELERNLDILERYQFEGKILVNGDHDLIPVNYFNPDDEKEATEWLTPLDILEQYTIGALNFYRKKFLETKDETTKKLYWWQLIQLLPSSYNQTRSLAMNYEVLANMYEWRKNHKLDEWRTFCHWIEELPNSTLITGDLSEG